MTERKHKWAEVIKAWADGKTISALNLTLIQKNSLKQNR